MTYQSFKDQVLKYQDAGKRLFTTSSFQTHSLVMLHMLSRIDPDIPVVFINTGYHFPETLKFRDRIVRSFGLTNTIDLKSALPRYMQRDADGRLLFTSDPDHCCAINKTEPVDQLLMQHDVWINGIRGDQSSVRKNMKTEQPAPHGTVRFHPMLDWTSRMIFEYRKAHDLPAHPLDDKGYISIGCEPCTRRLTPDMSEREARWFGLNKVECGLHTDLVK
jgi:phosphoadenosine phosphosulfate reductase